MRRGTQYSDISRGAVYAGKHIKGAFISIWNNQNSEQCTTSQKCFYKVIGFALPVWTRYSTVGVMKIYENFIYGVAGLDTVTVNSFGWVLFLDLVSHSASGMAQVATEASPILPRFWRKTLHYSTHLLYSLIICSFAINDDMRSMTSSLHKSCSSTFSRYVLVEKVAPVEWFV